jgi:hypothetical protein
LPVTYFREKNRSIPYISDQGHMHQAQGHFKSKKSQKFSFQFFPFSLPGIIEAQTGRVSYTRQIRGKINRAANHENNQQANIYPQIPQKLDPRQIHEYPLVGDHYVKNTPIRVCQSPYWHEDIAIVRHIVQTTDQIIVEDLVLIAEYRSVQGDEQDARDQDIGRDNQTVGEIVFQVEQEFGLHVVREDEYEEGEGVEEAAQTRHDYHGIEAALVNEGRVGDCAVFESFVAGAVE